MPETEMAISSKSIGKPNAMVSNISQYFNLMHVAKGNIT